MSRSAIVLVAVLSLVAWGCTKGSDTFVTVPGRSQGGGGEKVTVKGSGNVAAASVALPSNATNESTITLSQGTQVTGTAATASVGPAVQVTAPSGTSFSSPVRVTVPIDASKVTNAAEVVILQRNDATGAVKILRPIKVDLVAETAEVYVTSFSTFQGALVPNNAQIQGTYNAVAYLPDVERSGTGDAASWDIGAVSSDSKFTFDGAGGMTVVSGSEDAAILTLTRGSTASLTSNAKSPVNLNWTYTFNPTQGTLAITDHAGDPQHGVRNLDGTTVVFTFTSSGTDDLSRHIIVAVREGSTLDSSILKDAYNVLGIGTELETLAGPQDGRVRIVAFDGFLTDPNQGLLTKQAGTSNYALATKSQAGNSRSIDFNQPNGLVGGASVTAAHQNLSPAPIVVQSTGHLDFGTRKGVVSASGSLVFLQDAQNTPTSLGRHVFAAFERSTSYDPSDLEGDYQLVGLSRDMTQTGKFLEFNHITWRGQLTLKDGFADFGDRTGQEGRVSINMDGVGLTSSITAQTITRPRLVVNYNVTNSGRMFFDAGGQPFPGLAAPDGSLIVFSQPIGTGFGTSELWYALRVTSNQ